MRHAVTAGTEWGRRRRGLEHISEVKCAAIEYDGHTSIIPTEHVTGVGVGPKEEAHALE